MKHPMQPVVSIKSRIRFQENKIVSFLLDFAGEHGVNMNTLAKMPFDDDDRTQFAQLIGYSVSGAGELHYFASDVLEKADEAAEVLRQSADDAAKQSRCSSECTGGRCCEK